MRDTYRLKTWAGPLTFGSFVVIATSGVMLFFHLNIGAVKLVHEWLGWLLVVGGVAHLLANWRLFLAYFRRPVGVAIMAIPVVLGALSLLPAGGGPAGRPPFMDMSRMLEQSSLKLVAEVAKRSPESAIAALGSQGIHVEDGEQTISHIASDNGKRTMEVLACVIGNARGTAAPRERRAD